MGGWGWGWGAEVGRAEVWRAGCVCGGRGGVELGSGDKDKYECVRALPVTCWFLKSFSLFLFCSFV